MKRLGVKLTIGEKMKIRVIDLPQPLYNFILDRYQIKEVKWIEIIQSDKLPFDFLNDHKLGITLGRKIYLRNIPLDDKGIALLFHELHHAKQQDGKNPLSWSIHYIFDRLFGGKKLELEADEIMCYNLQKWREITRSPESPETRIYNFA